MDHHDSLMNWVTCHAKSTSVAGNWYGEGWGREEARRLALQRCDFNGPQRNCYIVECWGDRPNPSGYYLCEYFSRATGQYYTGEATYRDQAARMAFNECDRAGPQRHCVFVGCWHYR